MSTPDATEDSRLSVWLRVRRFAVPPIMIETATARREAGDWAGACAVAGLDTDLDPGAARRAYGSEIATRLRADLRHLAPDLLRWHMPRSAPDGLLRPGLTLSLARYRTGCGNRDGDTAVHLVARTPPAWADAPQRISLALWDTARPAVGVPRAHPHPRPNRRFRLDLHRHLWDARRSAELRIRSGADRPPDAGGHAAHALYDALPPGVAAQCAVVRWAAEAAIVLRAEGLPAAAGRVAVRLGPRRYAVLETAGDDAVSVPRIVPAPPGRPGTMLPLLPHAATWTAPDLALLRAELITPDLLHPLVAAALTGGSTAYGGTAGCDTTGGRDVGAADGTANAPGSPRIVECRGEQHRIALVDGVLAPLDHDPDEIRREELLGALSGTPLACLRVIDQAHRRPDCLPDVRARLDHGDTAGALAVVEALLGPGAALRNGALRDALETAARRRVDHGLYRAGLTDHGPRRSAPGQRQRRTTSYHPRNASR